MKINIGITPIINYLKSFLPSHQAEANEFYEACEFKELSELYLTATIIIHGQDSDDNYVAQTLYDWQSDLALKEKRIKTYFRIRKDCVMELEMRKTYRVGLSEDGISRRLTPVSVFVTEDVIIGG